MTSCKAQINNSASLKQKSHIKVVVFFVCFFLPRGSQVIFDLRS